jgi:hypothetical protein
MTKSKAAVATLGLLWAVGVMPGCGKEDSPEGSESGGSGLTTAGRGGSAGAAGAGAGRGGTSNVAGSSAAGSGNAGGSENTGGSGNTGGASAGSGTGGSGNAAGSAGSGGDSGAAGDAGESGSSQGGAGGTANGEAGDGAGGDDPRAGTSSGGAGNGGTAGGGTSGGGAGTGGASGSGTSGSGGVFDDSTLGLPETIVDGACGVCPIGLTCGGGGDAQVCGTVEAMPNGKVCSVDGFCFKYPNPQNNSLHDAFARGEAIWAVGARGTVLRYDGQSWSGLTNLVFGSNDAMTFYSVWVAPSGEVWIGGYGGLLLRGVGSTWNQLKIPTTVIPGNEYISALGGSSANDVWLGTTSGRFVHFDGQSFALVSTYSGALHDIEVVAANDIYLSGAHGISHYDGVTWASESGSFSTVYGVTARTPAEIWAAGGNAHIYRKLAGTWQTYTTGTTSYQAVIPRAANDVWAVGTHLSHFDGLAWTATSSAGSYDAAAGTAAGTAVAVGQNGSTVHLTSGTPVWVNNGQQEYWDFTSEIHGYSNTDLWFAGQDRSSNLSDDDSLLLHYDGAAFTRISRTDISSWGALWAERGGGVRLASGLESTARYYLPPGGTSVQSQPVGPSLLRRAYFGTADNALWAGGRGLLEFWNGTAWSTVAHPFAATSTTYTDMWGSAANSIWAVTDTASAAYYDGTTWEAVALPGTASGISGRSASEVYAADVDCVYDYDGESWSELHCFERRAQSVVSVAACNDTDVWIAGYGTSLIHYRGSQGWRDVRTGLDHMSKVFCVTPDKVWASGSGQAVLVLER